MITYILPFEKTFAYKIGCREEDGWQPSKENPVPPVQDFLRRELMRDLKAFFMLSVFFNMLEWKYIVYMENINISY